MEDISSISPAKATAGKPFLFAMIGIVLAGIGWFTYGYGLDHAFVGWGFLLAVPFALGALATGLGLYPFNLVGCLAAPAALFLIVMVVVSLGFAEGLICIAMVMPFWIAAGAGGGLATLVVRARQQKTETTNSIRLKVSAALTIPFAMIFVEEVSPPQWQSVSVARSVTINTEAERVWPMLLAIPEISPEEGIATFTHDFIGLARPSTATLELRGDTQVRVGHWGENISFEEHVTQRIEAERVAWRFVFPDDSVQAYTDRHIDPDGPILKIASGRYTLESLGNGQSRVTLVTDYKMRTRLGWYFGMWGEIMLGDVHDNVLAIIKQRAESRPRLPAPIAPI